MLIENLRTELGKIFVEKFAGIDTDLDAYIIEKGLGFFPYGSGLLSNNKQIPENCYLFLGQDFGTVKYAKGVQADGEANKTTMRNLLNEIIDEDKRDKVFLSNVYMGLRESNTNVGSYDAHQDKKYLQLCKSFLKFQIDYIKPFNVITLGNETEKFVRQNLPNLKTLKVRHPSSFFYMKSSARTELTKKIKEDVFN